jgi:acetylornithine deacetylase/succinyl-diaminopimelate desuccinylase-like protein
VAADETSITELFLDLVRVPSPSGRERAIALVIRNWLDRFGVIADFDGTGPLNDSDAGNLVATIPGASGAPGFLFVAHMDTVESGAPAIEPVLGADGVIRSSGRTILGADNKSAVAALMMLCKSVAGLPADARPTLHAAFTCREESGTMGASLLDLGDRTVDCAFCLDGSDPIGTVITRALGQTVFTIVIHGRRAHAAANPEAGVSAIRVAGEIVAALPLGRQAHGGSLGVAAIVGGGVIDRLTPSWIPRLRIDDEDAAGGDLVLAALEATPTNSVPDLAYLRGEARGFSTAAIGQTLETIARIVAGVAESHGAGHELRVDLDAAIPPMPGSRASRALALFEQAADATPGVEIVFKERPVTIEANYLAGPYDTIAIATGGQAPHQTAESITTAELEALADLLLGIVKAAAAPAAAS